MAHQLRVPVPAQSHRWWTASLSAAVPMQQPVALKCGDTDLALFRDESGKVRALLDQCAHRRAPLSLGKVTEAGLLECPYHGWRYEGQGGRCMAIPNLSAEEKVPRTYRVPAFAVHESDGFVHIWSGGDAEPDRSAPSMGLPSLGIDAHDSALLAYPHDACVDLLLDAPDAVLDIAGVAIVNAHRFGDPVIDGDHVEVIYAAIPASRRGKGLVSEYPYRVRLRVAIDGGDAFVQLLDDRDEVRSAAVIAFMPVKRTLCAISWKGSMPVPAENARSNSIGIRRTINPAVARDAVDYVSRLRK